MKKFLVLALCAVLCVSLLYCSKKKETPQKEAVIEITKDIVDIATEDGRFTTLVKAIEAAGLVETLKGPGPFTVFAPTEEAFAKLPPGTIESLLQDVPQLKNILLYHVIPGKIMAADLVQLTNTATVLGPELTIAKTEDGKVTIGSATVLITDIEAKNGVIHAIDTVLIPPPAAQ